MNTSMNTTDRRTPARTLRRGLLAGVFAVGGMLMLAATAWACSVDHDPSLNDLTPNRGPAGTVVAVAGNNWSSFTNVVLTWVPTGEVLGSIRPTGGAFSTNVTIPSSAEVGRDYVDYVKATQGATVIDRPYGVDSPAQAGHPGGSDPAATSSAAAAAQSSGAPSMGAYNGGSGGIPTGSAAGPPKATGQAPTPSPVPVLDQVSPNAPAPLTPVAAPASTPAPIDTPTAPVLAVPAPSASPVADPGAIAAPTAVQNPISAPAQAPAPAGAPSVHTAYADLWGGYGPATSAVPSLTDLPGPAAATSPVAIGAGLATVGLLAMMAGFGLVEVRSRQRVRVEG